ncbi:MAG TPA: hypothetical protein PK872_05175 [Ferruginibacter sp.]|nr:hypothetical protein [Ferruginibacter sp.]
MNRRPRCRLETHEGKEGTGPNNEPLKGQTATWRLLMIRSCFCIIVIFYKHLSSEGR